MIEILTGCNFQKAVEHLNLTSATCTYRHVFSNTARLHLEYQVWELSEEDFKYISNIKESEWNDDWGWWRYSDGSNLGAVSKVCMINDFALKVWSASKPSYPDLLIYLVEEIGASSEGNICSCAMDLAGQNGMKMSEIFQKCL